MPARHIAATAAAVLGLLAAATPATARSCNLVADKSVDAHIGPRTARVGNVEPLDIKSADVATGAKTLVVVLRLASTRAGESPMTAPGYYWKVTFELGGVYHSFVRVVDYLGRASDNASAAYQPIPGLTTKVDAGSITWTVPRANVAKLKSGRPVFSKFVAQTGTVRDAAGDRAPESGTSASKYVDRTASCVRAV